MQLLQQLEFDFTGPIDAARAQQFADLVCWVRIQLPVGASVFTPSQIPPVEALHGKASVNPSSFLWTLADDPQLVLQTLRTGGLILIDLDCDYILDANGNPVSGSAGQFVGSTAFAPGGIFRTWIQVLRG
jgi:hypothetical protein